MDPLAVLLFMGTVGLIGVGRYVWVHHRWGEVALVVGQQTGLPVVAGWRGVGLDRVEGERGGSRVVLRHAGSRPARPGEAGWRLFGLKRKVDFAEVTVTLPFDPGFAFKAEPTPVVRMLLRADPEVGDAGFDEAVRLSGDETAMRAALDAPTRAAVLGWVRVGGELVGRRLRVKWVHGHDAIEAGRRVEQALAVAAALRTQGTARARLAALVTDEAAVGVRRAALGFLLAQHGHAVETKRAARAALADGDDVVRLLGGRALGDEGVEALAGLLTSVSTRVAVGAAEALGGSAAGRAVLMRRLGGLSGAVRAAAVAALREQASLGGELSMVGAVGGLAVVDRAARVGRLAGARSAEAPREGGDEGGGDGDGAVPQHEVAHRGVVAREAERDEAEQADADAEQAGGGGVAAQQAAAEGEQHDDERERDGGAGAEAARAVPEGAGRGGEARGDEREADEAGDDADRRQQAQAAAVTE